MQIEMTALPLHKPQPVSLSGPGLDGPGPRSLPFPMQSVATPIHGASGAQPQVGRYPDPVARYPGPRRPGTRSVTIPIPSVAIPVPSAATLIHAVPELGWPVPIPP